MKILNVSDLHLRHDQPICRLDDNWIKAQQNIVDFIVQLGIKEKVDLILDNGDTYHTSVQPNTIVNIIPSAMKNFSDGKMKWVSLPGNHSLQYHQLENRDKSSIATLNFMENIEVLHCNELFESQYGNIQMVHRLIMETEKEIPIYMREKGVECAQDLLDAFPHHNLILTGDHHHSFEYEVDGRFVINPGCTMIQTADMMDYTPKVVLLDYDEANDKLLSTKWIEVPDDGEMTSNAHLMKVKESEEGIEEFLNQVKTQKNLTLDFWQNVEIYMEKNEIDESTKEQVNMIREACLNSEV